jgi:hypothetical protein
MEQRAFRKTVNGSLFTKCDLPIELFNTNRLAKSKMKQTLARLGFLMLRDGTLEIKGQNVPVLNSP